MLCGVLCFGISLQLTQSVVAAVGMDCVESCHEKFMRILLLISRQMVGAFPNGVQKLVRVERRCVAAIDFAYKSVHLTTETDSVGGDIPVAAAAAAAVVSKTRDGTHHRCCCSIAWRGSGWRDACNPFDGPIHMHATEKVVANEGVVTECLQYAVHETRVSKIAQSS